MAFDLTKRLPTVAIGLVVALVLCLAIIYIGAAQPILDDWCFAIAAGTPLEYANYMYSAWSGRWPTMFLVTAAVQGREVDTAQYLLLASGGLAVWFLGFLVVAHRLVERGKLMAAAVMLATFWSTTPGTGETFYWIASYLNYGMAFVLGALCLSIATRGLAPRGIALASLCGFLSAMFSELAGIVLLVAMAGLLAHRRLSRRPLRGALVIALFVALGTALVVFSPGSAARALVQAHMSWPKILWSVVRPYESPLSIIADPRLLALVAAILVLPNPNRVVPRYWWIVPVTAIAAAYVGVLAFVAGTGTTPSYRVLSFLQAGVMAAFAATAWQLRGLLPGARPAVHLAFAAILATAPVVGAALHDLPSLGEWRQSHAERWQYLRSNSGRDVALADHPAYPSIYPDRDVYFDPDNGINRCMATYFGVRSIRAVGPDGKRWRTAY